MFEMFEVLGAGLGEGDFLAPSVERLPDFWEPLLGAEDSAAWVSEAERSKSRALVRMRRINNLKV